MKKTMKAARLFGPNDLRIVDTPIPELGAHDVLTRVRRAGICGTDYSIYTGEFSFVKNGGVRFPFTPGHEWSGVVAAVGGEVTRFKIGDRVVGDTCVSCGNCVACLLGDYLSCAHAFCVGTVNAWDGGFAEYTVFPERHLFHLPDAVGFDAGAFVEPAATSLHAVKRAQVGIGDTVLVHGSGALGLLAAKLAKLSGASRVVVTGRKDAKLDIARAFGADGVVNTTREPLRASVLRLNGGETFDRVIETSGSPDLLTASFDLVRAGGTLAPVAFYDRTVDDVAIDRAVFGNLSICGSSGSTGMYPPILRLLASGALDIAPLISGRYPFADLLQGYRDMKDKNDIRIKWLVDFVQDE